MAEEEVEHYLLSARDLGYVVGVTALGMVLMAAVISATEMVLGSFWRPDDDSVWHVAWRIATVLPVLPVASVAYLGLGGKVKGWLAERLVGKVN